MTDLSALAEKVEGLDDALSILADAHKAYVEALAAPLRGPVSTEFELRAANGEREESAREAMFDFLCDLQPMHVAALLKGASNG